MTGSTDVFEAVVATWRPEPRTITGVVDEATTTRLAALLDVDAPGEGHPLPRLWHEVLLREPLRLAEVGPDGHPLGGALLPPLPDRRRMVGGGTVDTTAPLLVGERATVVSRVADVRVRDGRSGRLLLVTEEHRWLVGDDERLRERRDVVYRRPEDVGRTSPRAVASPPTPEASAAGSGATSVVVPDERLLFAFSALTYNLHRIHYDAPYAREVEHHPGLVVHGPLLALWCAEVARRHGVEGPGTTSYRLVATACVGDEVRLAVVPAAPGRLRVEAWARGRCCAWLETAAP